MPVCITLLPPLHPIKGQRFFSKKLGSMGGPNNLANNHVTFLIISYPVPLFFNRSKYLLYEKKLPSFRAYAIIT